MKTIKADRERIRLLRQGNGYYLADLFTDITEVTQEMEGETITQYECDWYQTRQPIKAESDEEAMAYFEEQFDNLVTMYRLIEENDAAAKSIEDARKYLDDTDYIIRKAIEESDTYEEMKQWIRDHKPEFLASSRKARDIINRRA